MQGWILDRESPGKAKIFPATCQVVGEGESKTVQLFGDLLAAMENRQQQTVAKLVKESPSFSYA